MSQSTIEEKVTETAHGREPAYMELFCLNCGDGVKFDMRQCETCGEMNPRYRA